MSHPGPIIPPEKVKDSGIGLLRPWFINRPSWIIPSVTQATTDWIVNSCSVPGLRGPSKKKKTWLARQWSTCHAEIWNGVLVEVPLGLGLRPLLSPGMQPKGTDHKWASYAEYYCGPEGERKTLINAIQLKCNNSGRIAGRRSSNPPKFWLFIFIIKYQIIYNKMWNVQNLKNRVCRPRLECGEAVGDSEMQHARFLVHSLAIVLSPHNREMLGHFCVSDQCFEEFRERLEVWVWEIRHVYIMIFTKFLWRSVLPLFGAWWEAESFLSIDFCSFVT